MIMMIYIIHLLLIGRRAWMAFDDKSPVHILKAIEQELTEHGTILYTFLTFATRYVMQMFSAGFDRIQQPTDYRTHDCGHNSRSYVIGHWPSVS